MKKQIQCIVAALACGLAALPLHAEVIPATAFLGIPANRGCWCVQRARNRPWAWASRPTYGALRDRACAGRLNRYAVDGRLLASYQVFPGSGPPSATPSPPPATT